jgi:NTE family protein
MRCSSPRHAKQMRRLLPGVCRMFLIFGIFISAVLSSGVVLATENESETRPTVGLVLSGGGARGAAHVGVIKVLDELRIPVDYIAGTSMGAIVGGLYASGMPAEELEHVFKAADWSALLADRPPRARRSFRRKSDDLGFLVDFDIGVDKSGLIFPEGLIQGQNLEIALKRLTLPVVFVDDFYDLPIPFRAMATDITSGEAVILDSGDLATAMRASMSAPGLFKPVWYEGRRLVDGGIANNLPVQLIRDMGADILIVVDVGFPLLPKTELGSALGITKQMLTILVNSRTQDQLAMMTSRDVLISPDLGTFGSQDFQRVAEALRLGEEKTRELIVNLADLSLSSEDYSAYRQRVESARQDTPIIDKVIVENESKLSPEVIASRLADQEGKPLDLDQLESDIANIYSFDTFETVTYNVFSDTDGTTLALKATEKSWGPNFLRFGISLEDDFSGESNYNFATRFTRTEINQKGGEFRAEIQIGDAPRIFAELYQPLDYASRWFINPQIELQRANSGLFENQLQIAQIRSDAATLSLAGGRNFSNWGEFRVDLSSSRVEDTQLIGQPGFESATVDINRLSARFAVDTLDSIAIPRSGTNFSLAWSGARESLGSDVSFDIAALFFVKPQTLGDNTILHWWNFGSTIKDQTDELQSFSLGGLFNLSGYTSGELAGKHLGIGRILYYHRMGGKPLTGIDMPVFLGASIEVGNVWQSTSEVSLDNTLVAASAFVMIDSILGPLYLAYGAAEGDRHSAYLFLGQTF